jgi:hypothetical protein
VSGYLDCLVDAGGRQHHQPWHTLFLDGVPVTEAFLSIWTVF